MFEREIIEKELRDMKQVFKLLNELKKCKLKYTL